MVIGLSAVRLAVNAPFELARGRKQYAGSQIRAAVDGAVLSARPIFERLLRPRSRSLA